MAVPSGSFGAGLVSLDVRHRLIAALRQAVAARLPVVEASDKDAVGFYTANDFVTTSLSGKYPVSNASACTWMQFADCGARTQALDT